MFTGTVRIKICEASGLRPTDFQKRLNMTFGKPADEQLIDPYVTVDVDETHVAQTTTKQKTFDPVWNEYFEHTVENAKTLTLTVFHDAAIPPDDFVANCSIPFEDLLVKENEECDFWVSVYIVYVYLLFSMRSTIAECAATSATPLPYSVSTIRFPSF